MTTGTMPCVIQANLGKPSRQRYIETRDDSLRLWAACTVAEAMPSISEVADASAASGRTNSGLEPFQLSASSMMHRIISTDSTGYLQTQHVKDMGRERARKNQPRKNYPVLKGESRNGWVSVRRPILDRKGEGGTWPPEMAANRPRSHEIPVPKRVIQTLTHFPCALSPESITASAPSYTAFVTSLTSALQTQNPTYKYATKTARATNKQEQHLQGTKNIQFREGWDRCDMLRIQQYQINPLVVYEACDSTVMVGVGGSRV